MWSCFRASVLVTLLLPSLTACRDNDSNTQKQLDDTGFEAPAKEQTALAFFGGFGSCLDNTMQQLGPSDQVLKNVFEPSKLAADALNARSDLSTPYLMTCYNFSNQELSYVLSNDGQAPEIRKATLETIADELNASLLSADGTSIRLILVGHSWGGWTAMKMATYLDKNIKIGGLVTLDPIDRENCGPVEIAASSTRVAGEACRKAPDHVTKGDELNMAEGAQWLNYYQTQFFLLHSGPIASASKNIEKTYSITSFDRRSHIKFISDPETIQDVANLVVPSPTASEMTATAP